MNTRLKAVLGTLRLLGQRVRDLGHPGLRLWTFAGEQAVQAASREIVDKAHRNECTERTVAGELAEIVADGRVTPAELARLRSMPPTLTGCAERSHDITEAAAL